MTPSRSNVSGYPDSEYHQSYVYEDGVTPAGPAWGWNAWDDGRWDAYFGMEGTHGKEPDRAAAESAARAWIERKASERSFEL